MASLNLVPNPTVVAVQMGIFLTNLYIVKKMLLEPYLVLRAKRDGLTTGSQKDSERLSQESEAMTQSITTAVQSALVSASGAVEQIRATAQKRKDEIVKQAEEVARVQIENARKEIVSNLQAERAKIPATVKSVADEIYRMTLS